MTVFYSATLDHKSRFRSDFFFKYSALNLVYITLRRQLTPPPLVSLRNDFWGTTADIPYWWRVTTQIWVRVLIGWKFYLSNQKHNTDLVVAFISMEFLRSFPRRHFKGKPVMAWRNFGCFLRLHWRRFFPIHKCHRIYNIRGLRIPRHRFYTHHLIPEHSFDLEVFTLNSGLEMSGHANKPKLIQIFRLFWYLMKRRE